MTSGRLRQTLAPWLLGIALTVAAPPALGATAADSIRYASRITDINQVGLTLTNYGFFGNNFNSRTASFEYPLGSGYEHMSRGGLWVGAIALSDTTVTDEVLLAARAFRLSPYEIKRLVINGFKSSFLPYADKARRLREVNLEIDRIFMEEFPDDYDRRLTSY